MRTATKMSKLRATRLLAGLSQEELAKAVGTTRQTIHNLEKGKYRNIKAEIMLKLAKYFNMPVEELFYEHPVIQELQNPTPDERAG